jgi:hypothetical protein
MRQLSHREKADRKALRRMLNELDGDRMRVLCQILHDDFLAGLLRNQAATTGWLLGRGNWGRARRLLKSWSRTCALTCHHDGLTEKQQRDQAPALVTFVTCQYQLAHVKVEFTTAPMPRNCPKGEMHVPAPWSAKNVSVAGRSCSRRPVTSNLKKGCVQ